MCRSHPQARYEPTRLTLIFWLNCTPNCSPPGARNRQKCYRRQRKYFLDRFQSSSLAPGQEFQKGKRSISSDCARPSGCCVDGTSAGAVTLDQKTKDSAKFAPENSWFPHRWAAMPATAFRAKITSDKRSRAVFSERATLGLSNGCGIPRKLLILNILYRWQSLVRAAILPSL